MSDHDNVEQKIKEEAQEIDISVEQLADAGAKAAEDQTHDPVDSEIEQIDVEALAGTQPEKKEAEKEHNRLYAENRVKTKRLRQLQAQLENGVIPESHAFKPQEAKEKPKLDDFVKGDRFYDDFNGNEAIALAAYQEAKEEWQSGSKSVDAQKEEHLATLRERTMAEIAREEAFDESVAKFGKSVKGLDDSLSKAEKLLGERDFIAVRDVIGDNAALVLAVIGSNAKEQRDFLAVADKAAVTGDPTAIIKHLTLLEHRVLSNFPSAKTISNAASEKPVGGGEKVDSNLDALIDKASKAGDADEYRRLMNIKRGRSAA